MLASSASDAPVGGPDGGARPFCASVSSPKNQSSGGCVQNSLVPDSYFFSGFCCCCCCCALTCVIPAIARMAAHASMDRRKADVIASLPVRRGSSRACLFSTLRRRAFGLRWSRRGEASTSGRREKRGAQGVVGRKGFRKKFL